MRGRIVALAVGVALVILGLVILLRPSGDDRRVVRTDGPSAEATPEATEPETASSAAPAPRSGFSIPNPLDLLELGKIKAAVSGQNQRLNLHAVVRDQYDQAVPNARLLMYVVSWKAVPPRMFTSVEKETWVSAGANGRIDQDLGRGSSLCVRKAEGPGMDLELLTSYCYLPDRNDLALYKLPTRQNPAIIRVWKSKGREAVHVVGWNMDLTKPGVFYVDAVTGMAKTQWFATADFKVELTYVPRDKVPYQARDYALVESAKVTALDGGVQSTNDRFTYEAPEKGYTTTTIVRGPWQDGVKAPGKPGRDGEHFWHHGGSWDGSVYFHVRGRFYGTLNLNFMEVFDLDTVSVTARTVLSPTGGRILQLDEERSQEVGAIDWAELSRKTARLKAEPANTKGPAAPPPTQTGP